MSILRAICFIFVLATSILIGKEKVELGIDRLFKEDYSSALKNKRIGLIANHTSVDRDLHPTVELFKQRGKDFKLVALFSPEHGLNGVAFAGEEVQHSKDHHNIPIYSLHGATRRPTDAMLKGIDVLVFDIQEIGVRSYSYASTLFYVMEAAAKKGIEVIVLDRPNPINGLVVDGPMLNKEWRSFLGYINVPYCHGMTVGELSLFFNEEYKIRCKLKVVPMSGWKRGMSYKDTGLYWIPTSPYIPEEDTPFFYASTGILGVLSIVNIGIGYTLPFKVVGAPWIKGQEFADRLNAQKLPGVKFFPICYRPIYGLFAKKDCQGVKIIITDTKRYKPLAVQYLILGMLKTLYPKEINERLATLDEAKKNLFCKVNGNTELLSFLMNEKYAAWKMIQFEEDQRKAFLNKREKYLLY